MLGLTWDAIDLKKGTIRVYRQLKRVPAKSGTGKEFILQTTKSPSTDRILDIDEDIIAVLRTHRANQLEEKLIVGKRWKEPWGLVFVSENGGPIHASNLLDHFNRTLATAELPKIRIHDLRHTYAALSIAAGVDLYTLSRRMGHNSITVTADKYGHLYQGHTQDIESLDRLLKRA